MADGLTASIILDSRWNRGASVAFVVQSIDTMRII
jgi:hypothetical protein